MTKPKFTDYVELIDTLFGKFTQAQTTTTKPGHPVDFKYQTFLIFF